MPPKAQIPKKPMDDVVMLKVLKAREKKALTGDKRGGMSSASVECVGDPVGMHGGSLGAPQKKQKIDEEKEVQSTLNKTYIPSSNLGTTLTQPTIMPPNPDAEKWFPIEQVVEHDEDMTKSRKQEALEESKHKLINCIMIEEDE
ncbi:long-chain fatty acid--CoA ligase [Sesbania bispinosa]|nr:long-chain fatty acid--CoA ligase [Sesbania bispinosa]